ncbi:MAG: fibronectin type III domain-containing protein [Bacteroidales bacterium]|nr:fibronectin type III domain-containing protein [Bacteroidales bacterium]
MFTTTAISLATVTTTVISATGTTAIIEGNVTADGGSLVTARGICWGLNTNPTVSGNKTTEGSGTGTFRSTLTALSTNVTYHVRAYATNSAGVQYGNGETFILTGDKPTAVTDQPLIQSGSAAVLYGTVNPNWAETTVTFEYGLTTSYGTSVPNFEGLLGAGLYDYSVSANIDGLEPGKTYHFRVRAENSLGITFSADRTFTTYGDKPTAVADEPLIQNGSAAVLYGTVNPNWAETTVTFEYGLTNSYGTIVPNFEGLLGAGLTFLSPP